MNQQLGERRMFDMYISRTSPSNDPGELNGSHQCILKTLMIRLVWPAGNGDPCDLVLGDSRRQVPILEIYVCDILPLVNFHTNPRVWVSGKTRGMSHTLIHLAGAAVIHSADKRANTGLPPWCRLKFD